MNDEQLNAFENGLTDCKNGNFASFAFYRACPNLMLYYKHGYRRGMAVRKHVWQETLTDYVRG